MNASTTFGLDVSSVCACTAYATQPPFLEILFKKYNVADRMLFMFFVLFFIVGLAPIHHRQAEAVTAQWGRFLASLAQPRTL